MVSKLPHKVRIAAQASIGLVLTVLLGWLILHGLDWGEFATEIARFPASLFFLALAVFLVAIVLRAWRWYILIVHEKIGFIRLFLIQNAGIGLNNLSPIRVVSEPLQLALVTRRGGLSAATGLATLAMEHILDVFVTAALLGLSVLLMPELQRYSIQLASAVVFAAASLIVFIVIARGMDTIPGTRRIQFLNRAVSAARTLAGSPGRLLLSFLATLGHWSLLGLSGWIIARGIGIDVDVAVVVVLFMGSIFFVAAVPSLPGGAVTFEASVVYTLGLFDIPRGQALAFALIMHVIMFVPSTLIAALVLPGQGIKMFGRGSAAVPASLKDD
jgi:uncharacterized protein (TIRG00374 family)